MDIEAPSSPEPSVLITMHPSAGRSGYGIPPVRGWNRSAPGSAEVCAPVRSCCCTMATAMIRLETAGKPPQLFQASSEIFGMRGTGLSGSARWWRREPQGMDDARSGRHPRGLRDSFRHHLSVGADYGL